MILETKIIKKIFFFTPSLYLVIDRFAIVLYNIVWNDVDFPKMIKFIFSKNKGVIMEKDYSNYKPSEKEKYYSLREENKYIFYNYFQNKVRFNEGNKTLEIFVDNEKEDFNMDYHFDISNELHGLPTDDYEPIDRTEKILENEKYKEYFIKKHNIDFNKSSYFCHSVDDVPINNIFCGCSFSLNIGEGILDFIYADFNTPIKNSKTFAYTMEHIFPIAFPKSELTIEQLEKLKEPEQVLSIDDRIIADYFKYKDTLIHTKEINYASVYSAICPPVFNSKTEPHSGLKMYYRYLNILQKEFLDLIEFCFDDQFCSDILGQYTPYERFYIYRSFKELPLWFDRTEVFTVSTSPNNGLPPIWLADITYLSREIKKIPDSDSIQKLSEKFNVSAEKLKEALVTPHYLDKYYSFSTMSEILELEFTKMLEMDIRFRKCQRCGKYFIMKGKYSTKYCSRVADGETQSCQKLAALDNYNEKNADNEAVKIYNKYYKRYKAREKVNQIKPGPFKKWQMEALAKRLECETGKLSSEEYIAWNESAFPNRKPKNK